MKYRVWLSGRNNQDIARTVNAYAFNDRAYVSDSWEIGTVTPVETKDWGLTWASSASTRK